MHRAPSLEREMTRNGSHANATSTPTSTAPTPEPVVLPGAIPERRTSLLPGWEMFEAEVKGSDTPVMYYYHNETGEFPL
jgi:hypothetical protein